MKFLRILSVLAVVCVFFVFAAACGGREDYSELVRINEQLQEEVNRLLAVISAGDYLCEYPVFNVDIQSLLSDASISEVGFEPGIQQAGWQNLATQSTGREYILWRGSWGNLSDTEAYINLLVQNGWELVNMFGAGQLNNHIVVVMRR